MRSKKKLVAPAVPHSAFRVPNSPPSFDARRQKQLLALLLFGAFALAAGSAAQKSVTVDEFPGLPLGLATLKTGDAHLGVTTPLLPSVLAAVPLLATSARFDPAPVAEYTSSWQTGGQFLRENALAADIPPENRGRYHDYFLLGRLVSIAVLLAACGLAYGYARSLYGPLAGLVAAAFCCFSPNLLAHGPLITPDIYLTAAIVGSLWAFDRLLRRPGVTSALVLGLALGLAALAKLTGLLLLGVVPALLAALQLAARLRPRAETSDAEAGDFDLAHGKRIWLALLAAGVVAIAAINLAYLGGGSFAPLGDYELASRQLQSVQQHLPGWLPVPLPRYFFLSIDAQLAEEGYTAYLLGQFNEQGYHYYYLVGLLVKTPLPVLLLAALACFWGGPLRRREWLLLGVGAALLCFFSLARHKNIGMRYVLFLEPMLAIWIARLAAPGAWNTISRQRRIRWATGLGFVGLLFANLSIWPDYLAWFNWASGGPNHGHYYLLDSNLDWGQDLIALRRYQEHEGIDSLDLAYFGRVPPEVYGVKYRPLGAQPPARFAAISANLLWGRMYIINGDPRYWPQDPDTFAAYRKRKPMAVLGHTIYVFDMQESGAESPGAQPRKTSVNRPKAPRSS